jgi:hypothetical protein
MNWYYESGGGQQGPVAESELDRLLDARTITPDTLVWREGMAGWAPLRTARPATPPPPASNAQPDVDGSDVPQPGWIRCTLTGRYFPPSEIITIDGKPYSAAAKPQVVASLEQRGIAPVSEADRNGPAWENRQAIGFVPALWQTMKAALFEPDRTFRAMKREGGLGTPFGYAFIGMGIGMLVMLVILMVFMMPIIVATISGAQKNSGGQPVPTALLAGGGVVAFILYAVLLLSSAAVTPWIYAGITHLCLMLVGGAKQPFETTFRTWCYAHGSGMLLMVVPVCGWMAAGIWAIVVLCIGLARTHEIHTGRATIAVLLPIIACCLLDVGINVIVAIASSASRGS